MGFGVAAPIRDYTGAVVGTVTIGGPRARVSDARLHERAEMVKAAAAQVSTAVIYASGEFLLAGGA